MWALSFVSATGRYREATCVELKGQAYVVYSLSWEVADDGRRTGMPEITDTITLEPEELGEFALPVEVVCSRPWELEPGSVLSHGMFPTPNGPKKVVR
jgi:hypothetical protein